MDIHVLGASLEIKFMDGGDCAPGTFEGLGAVFGNVDSVGDLIEPGAFSKSLYACKACGKYPPMRKMHGMGASSLDPIGVWDHMEEDSRGLIVKGRLVGLDTEQGKWNYAQLREGALKGLSIGYRVSPNGSRRGSGKMGEPARYLKQIDLKEVSLVDMPANALATVTAMKSLYGAAADISFDPREMEGALRDAGLSRADAVKGVAVFRTYLRRDAGDADPALRDEAAAAELVTAIKAAADRLRAL
ncbi:HK97 family phage prohead protease [Rhodoplanes elegans]|nr:HK97 family phage prohead protease [Rhodoplanes elegans]